MADALQANAESVPRSKLYYHHSGVAPPGFVALGLIVGLIVGMAAAVLYAAGDVYIPYVYIKCLFNIGLASVLGGVPAAVMRWGKVRNALITSLVVLAVTAVGYYTSWVAWICVLLAKAGLTMHPARLFVHPLAVWRVAAILNVKGTGGFENAGPKMSALALWFLWLGEAALVWGWSLKVAGKIAGAEPFCDACGRWCGKSKRLGTAAMRDVKELRGQLEGGDFGAITPLSADVPTTSAAWLSFWHHTCPGCGQLNTLTVQKAKIVKEGFGRKRIMLKTVIPKLLLHPGEAEQLAPVAAAPIDHAPTDPPPAAT